MPHCLRAETHQLCHLWLSLPVCLPRFDFEQQIGSSEQSHDCGCAIHLHFSLQVLENGNRPEAAAGWGEGRSLHGAALASLCLALAAACTTTHSFCSFLIWGWRTAGSVWTVHSTTPSSANKSKRSALNLETITHTKSIPGGSYTHQKYSRRIATQHPLADVLQCFGIYFSQY